MIPSAFILEPGQTRGVLLRAIAPDLMFSQQYPLEAALQFCAQDVAWGPGAGEWQRGGGGGGGTTTSSSRDGDNNDPAAASVSTLLCIEAIM